MKEIIEKTMKDYIKKLQDKTPIHKVKYHFVDIMDVKPTELVEFMKENNIPLNAEFEGDGKGYDGDNTSFGLSWTTPTPTTQKDKDNFVKGYFKRNFHTKLHKTLTKQGYKRANSFDSIRYRNSGIVNIYDACINNIDKVVDYYNYMYSKE